jgi:hypothetical protein
MKKSVGRDAGQTEPRKVVRITVAVAMAPAAKTVTLAGSASLFVRCEVRGTIPLL